MPGRLATGIPTIDKMIQGGLPLGSCVAVQGPEGALTFRIALSFLAAGLKEGASALVVVFAESADSVLAEFLRLGVDLDRVMSERRLRIIDRHGDGEAQPSKTDGKPHPSQFPAALLDANVRMSQAFAALHGTGPTRAVVESLSFVARAYSIETACTFARSVRIRFDRLKVTSLFLVDKSLHSSTELSVLQRPFTGVIDCERSPEGNAMVDRVGVPRLEQTTRDPIYHVLPEMAGTVTQESSAIATKAATPVSTETVSACPVCETSVSTKRGNCPTCGVRFVHRPPTEEGADVQGPLPSNRPAPTEPRILAAGAKALEPPVGTRAPAGPTGPTRNARSERGLTNGLVLERSRGRPPGMTNGLAGRTNGLTNGTGRTNGLGKQIGKTNGLAPARPRVKSLHDDGLLRKVPRDWRWYLIPLVGAIILLIPFIYVPAYNGPLYPIQIDGQFADWNGVSHLTVTSAAANPDIDITQVAVKDNLEYLAFYIQVRGTALNGGPTPERVTNAFYAFIDVDRSASTGYRVQGIGADRMVRIKTWGGQVVSSALMAFNSSRSPTDWNGWTPIGPVYAAGSGNRIEFETPRLNLAQNPVPVDVAFASRSWDGQSDAADLVVTDAEPFLLVRQVTGAPLVASGSGTNLAQVTLLAMDGTVTVHAINVTFTGTFGPSSISVVDLVDASSGVLSTQPIAPLVHFSFSPITLASGDTRVFSVRPHVSSSDGTTVGAFVRDVEDVMVSGGGVAFVGARTTPIALAYVGVVPSGPRVDGAFGEWTNVTPDPIGDVQPVWNRDVDLSAYGFQGYRNDTYFEASVVGTVLNGTMVPALNPTFIPATGNGSSNGTISPPPPPVAGTDYVRFFVDTDANASTGYTIGGLGADFLVEITGKNGLILSSDALRFAGANPFDWMWTRLGAAPAAKDVGQIEASLPGVRITNASRAFVQVSGWNGARDDSSPALPITVLSVNGASPGSSPALISSSDLLSAQDISGNTKWFFTNGAATATNGCTNTYAASTTAGSSPTSADITGTSSVCWTTPAGQPASTGAGTWEFYLDIASKVDGSQILAPSSNGVVDQWSTVGANPCNSGAPWQCVKDDPNDGDTTYVVSTSSSVIDELFQIQSWTPTPPSPLSIINITVEASCKYVGGSGDLRGLVRVGATIYAGGSLPTCPSASYAIERSAWTTNPSNNNPWAFSDLSSLQIGVRDNDATTNEVRVSNLRLVIYFNPIYSVQIEICNTATCGSSTSLYGPTNANSFGNDVLQTTSIAAQSLTASQYLRFRVAAVFGGTVTVDYNGPNPGTSDSRVTIPIPEFGEIVLPLGGTIVIAAIIPRWIRRRKRPNDQPSCRAL